MGLYYAMYKTIVVLDGTDLYQGAVIKTHRDRVRLFPGEVGSRGRCEPHRLGFLTPSGGERPRPKAASRGASVCRSARLAMLQHRGERSAPSRKPREAVSMSLYH